MTNGVVAELSELIDLRRYAQSVRYQPEGRVVRAGTHLSKLRGRGMDFAEVRNYQPGDEVRHMEWRVTARTGKPHVKIYQEERERPVIVLADFNPTMIFGTRVAFKSVIAARLAALLAWTAVKQGDRIGGLLFSANEHTEFTPRGRDSGVLPLLASLSHYTDQSESQRIEKPRALSDALTRLRRVVRPGSIVVLISDFYTMDAESEKQLLRLRASNDVLAYHIYDPIEQTPPKPHQYAITNGQLELILDTGFASVRNAYQEYFTQKDERLKASFKRLQIQYVGVSAEMNLAQLVRQTFPRRTHG